MDLFKRQKQFFLQVVDDQNVTTDIIGAKKLSGTQALSIYQEAYHARLQDALSEKYESVWTILGDKEFSTLCQKYIRSNKPTNYNLGNYGGKFCQFLSREKIIKDKFPFLINLSEFEDLFDQVFHSQTEKLASYNKDTFPPLRDTSCFKLVSYLKLPIFQYNIYDIWRAAQNGTQEQNLLPTTQYLLLSKNKDSVFVRVIDQMTSYLLKCSLEGQNLSDIMASYKSSNLSPDDLSKSLRTLLNSYVLVEIV